MLDSRAPRRLRRSEKANKPRRSRRACCEPGKSWGAKAQSTAACGRVLRQTGFHERTFTSLEKSGVMHLTPGAPSPAADFLGKRRGPSYAAKNFIQESGREKSWDSSSVSCKIRSPPLSRCHSPVAGISWRLPLVSLPLRSRDGVPHRDCSAYLAAIGASRRNGNDPAPTRPQCVDAAMEQRPYRRRGGNRILLPRSWRGGRARSRRPAQSEKLRSSRQEPKGKDCPSFGHVFFPDSDDAFRLQATAVGWNRLPRIDLASLRRRCGRGP